jgi:putative endonuclease
MYFVYILRCADDTLYVGITTDVSRRVTEHNTSTLGAKYTRGRRPVTLVYTRRYLTRSTASREEARIKSLSRKEKLGLLQLSTKRKKE